MTDLRPTDDSHAVVIERTFAAPIERVWSMWTEAEHFAAWYGPTGARIPTCRMDVTVGGSRLVCMEMDTPDGAMQMWFTGEYRVVDAPNRLVYTEAMADENGNVKTPAEMGMPDDHPMITEVTVELRPGDDGSTAMVMTHAGIPADSPGAMGWNMAIDALDDLLRS